METTSLDRGHRRARRCFVRRITLSPWLQGKDMYLTLENDTLSLVDPMDRSVLHSQPIVSIRVWGVGRDNGR